MTTWAWWGPPGLQYRHAITSRELYSRHPETGDAPDLRRAACGRGIARKRRDAHGKLPAKRCPRCVVEVEAKR